jgi:septal ring factor EnvC (AmiA/AmiB activator)
MVEGRHADSDRRRQRVRKALDTALANGDQISVSGIARAAGVDRSFLYRHHDLLEQLHAADTQPPNTAAGTTVSRASLQADLLAAQQRYARLAAHTRRLETQLSDLLGEHAWHESGLGDPADIEALNQRITTLDGQVTDLRVQLEERDQDLAAARATNRELMARLNTSTTNG